MPNMFKYFLILFSVLSSAAISSASEETLPAEQVKFFETHIRPLLVEHCISCHGPDTQKGELRLDVKQGALSVGGESGPPVIPHKPDESLLLEAVRYESYEMPPDEQLPADKIKLIEQWIANGAVWPDDSEDVTLTKSGTITEEDRNYWAFVPAENSTPPETKNNDWCNNEIDHYILNKLEENDLQPSSPASKRELIRRVYFDTIGLPPTADEIEKFVNNQSPQAYENLVDQLLADPRFGEHWARQWLDLVRYAESDGYRQDAYRPQAWKYRDYVIRSFNEDKPYDLFVHEQIAGDELYPENPDALIATSFLRLGVYEYNQRDVRTHWQDILNEMTDVTSDVFLGLGMGCARCHNHKFDPILQKDYFALQAFMAPVLWTDDTPLATPEEKAAYDAQLQKWESATYEIREKISQIEAPILTSLANSAINKFPEDIQVMMRKPIEEREPLEHQLAELAYRQVIREHDKLKSKLKDEKLENWQALQEELAKFDSLKPKPLPTGPTVADVSQSAPPTYMKTRLETKTIEPEFIEVLSTRTQEILPSVTDHSTGRRSALATWLTQPTHPLTARVMVNRLWQHHFGKGLAPSPSDFGTLGEPPTHPQLLDKLAIEFVESGWKMKPMHRKMLLSATYQQSSSLDDNAVASSRALLIDPQNSLLWRANRFRLNADEFRDSILAATGELSSKMGGPSVSGNSSQRSIYTKVIRNQQDPFFGAFDAPRGTSSTSERNRTTTSTQALMMMNGSWILERASVLAKAARNESPGNSQAAIEELYQRVLKRSPKPEETEQALAFLEMTVEDLNDSAKSDEGTYAEMPARSGMAIDLNGTPKTPLPTMQSELLNDTEEFTIEAIVLFEDATVRTIVSQWNNDQKTAGYALGVTSQKSAYQPRNLILQLIGKTDSAAVQYEVIASNIHLDLNKPYYVSVRVKAGDTSESGITFTVQELSDNTPVQSAQVKHQVKSNFVSPHISTVIGGRHSTSRHHWEGLIDHIRISRRMLNDEELLLNQEDLPQDVIADWNFEKNLKDSSTAKNDLKSYEGANSDPLQTALVDLAHALLNCNEFLYVD